MTTQVDVVYDGIRRSVVQLTAVSEGGVAESMVKKIDVEQLQYRPSVVGIQEIAYDVSGGLVRLWWEADDPKLIVELTGQSVFCYDDMGDLPNPRPPGFTGNILLSAVGFDIGSSYTIKLKLKKKNNRSPVA